MLRLFYFYNMPIQHLVLFDGFHRNNLLPIVATRAVADIRIGILTIREKWECLLSLPVHILTADYLRAKYAHPPVGHTTFINATVLPQQDWLDVVMDMPADSVLKSGDTVVAVNTTAVIKTLAQLQDIAAQLPVLMLKSDSRQINYPWDIFRLNGVEIKQDIRRMKLTPNGEVLSATNQLLGTEIYVADGVQCECAVLNAQHGPIYLGKDSEVMEGCTVRGPFALGEHSSLKMQAKIYGDTTIGPHCKVGGEVSNSVIIGYSNKGHDGFLGNAVVGEWCNLGADTNNSNLKNNYGKIKAWNYPAKDYINTNLQFCGLIMGDFAKSSINTMFNTGTVVGVAANVFEGGFPPKFIPDFSWGLNETFQLEKAFEVAERMMERRGVLLSDIDRGVLHHIFTETEIFRK